MPTDHDPREAVGDALEQSNEDFLGEHAARVARARAALERGEPPTLLRVEDSLVLRFEDRKWRVKLVGDAYNSLMRACHVPAAMALQFRPDAPFPEQLVDYVARLRDEADAEPLARALVERCGALLEGPPIARWEEVIGPLREAVDRCVYRAAELEVHSLHRATCELMARCGARRDELRFVVCAGHQPRYRELTKQYFQRLTGESDDANRSDERLVYAENCSEDEAMQLLACQQVDAELALRIWGDPQRMQRDVLSEAATAVLDKLDPTSTRDRAAD